MTNDVDKVLEAERSIEAMAAELTRMRRAADLLNAAQDNADALLRASDSIINQAGKFAGEGAEIIRRLSGMDLESRLDEAARQSMETQALLSQQLDRVNEALERLDRRNTELVQASGTLKQEVTQNIQGVGNQLVSQVERTRADLQNAFTTSQQSLQRLLEEIQRMQDEAARQSRRERRQALILTGTNLVVLLIVLALQLMK